MNSPEIVQPYWHDGVIISCSTNLSGGVYYVEICVDLYETVESPKRRRYKMLFYDVLDFILAVDVAAMNDNLTAGNIGDYKMAGSISQVKPYEENKCLHIYLVEGYIKVEFGRMEVIPFSVPL